MPLYFEPKNHEHNPSVNKNTDISLFRSTEGCHNNVLYHTKYVSNNSLYLCQERPTTIPPDNSQNRIDQVKSVRNGALLSEMPQCEKETTTIEVEMGEVRTVTDHQTVLFTTNLTDCSALVLLSNREGSNYQTRTMMHLIGGDLDYGLKSEYKKEIEKIAPLRKAPNNQVKIIWAGGVNSSSESDLSMSLSQDPILLSLMKHPEVSVAVVGCHGISVKPDGTVVLQNSVCAKSDTEAKLFLNNLK